MRPRILGKDLPVSAVGFGCMGISHAYGEPMEKSKESVFYEKRLKRDIPFSIRRNVIADTNA